ncbi:MAG: methylenetetrahydrofolate reductase [NAD(P)H] [Candidatus Eremiobacteraeota bacterium]|nr:methylenetetrahydrofolate reductase [NAD(P)H] [Candidatus Eremiobacteraeota bacterium]
MRIPEALASVRPFFSFEFFPPKTEAGEEQLIATIEALRPLRPSFVSVTYGAGGSTRARTLGIAKRIRNQVGLEVLAHATLVGATRAELRDLFDDLARAGIENVLALRGDAAPGETYVPTDGGLAGSTDLIAMLARSYDFSLGAACYPEAHVDASDPSADLAYARAKVDAGAQFLITQLFFDNDKYFSYVERARAAGIAVPILPGVMPITNYEQIERFTRMCGATIPPKLRVELEDRRDEPGAVEDLGVAYATLQCTDLLRRGAPGVHFYTLNKSPATRAIVSSLLAASAWNVSFA